ncbi:MAG: NADH-quinone oxidoreductase subunit M [Verrucomicrobia bacterium]|nr:NADH-quinone oxidoreductase subunit M [Verrucomicrobiota bacterium]
MSGFPLLTILTLLPMVGAALLLGMEHKKWPRCLAIALSFVALGLTLCLVAHFDRSSPDIQFVERHVWIPTLNVEYFVGVDGLSLTLLLLTAIVTPMALLASRGITEKPQLYYALILFLQSGLFGAFTALNFFHWFLYWELTLIPAFFLVKFWGGPQRHGASLQFFIYTMAGSIALLLAFLAVYQATGTFDLIVLAEKGRTGELASAMLVKLGWYGLTAKQLSLVIFSLAFLGFAVKTPLMPFHSWLPATYTEAPTPVTMLLTGLMSKLGVYGFLRLLLPLFPEAMRAVLTPLLWLAVATIVLSAAAALVQTDLKRVLAYSSINHLGYCLLGLFTAVSVTAPDARWAVEKTAALNGVVLQMFNHGLTAATLFMFVGFLEQRGARGLGDFGGLRKIAPVFCGLMGIAIFSSLGLPGLNGFIGEFLIFKGAFPLAPWTTALSAAGLLLTAIFLLTLMQRIFHGPLNEKWSAFADLTLRERLLVAPPIALMFVLGIYPQLLIGLFNATMTQFAENLRF